MKENYTHIAVVLDSSSSMFSILKDTIGGFNQFLKAQKEAEGEATLTLVEFAKSESFLGRGIPQNNLNWITPNIVNDGVPNRVDVDVKYEFQPIKAVPELTEFNYRPSGMTPLLDTIAETILRTGRSLAALPESLRPSKVLFVIITDGEENASRVWRQKEKVMELVKHQTIVYKWEFMYLGANQDAIAVGASFGVAASRSMSYGVTAEAVGQTYSVLANKTASFRSAKNDAEIQASLNFTAEERKSAEDSK